MTSQGFTEQVIQRLRQEGMKLTPQRLAVVRYLDGNRAHPSVDEIHRGVVREFPTISLATVYNTLEMLERLEVVRSVFLDGGRRRYDPDTRPHHHAVCRRCHRVEDVFPEATESIPVPGAVTDGFSEVVPVVLYQGLCHSCSGYAVF